MAAKIDLTARLSKWAAIVPLLALVFAVLAWGLRTDAAVKTLEAHDVQNNATDRLARLEEGQKDANKQLDHIQGQLEVIVRQTK